MLLVVAFVASLAAVAKLSIAPRLAQNRKLNPIPLSLIGGAAGLALYVIAQNSDWSPDFVPAVLISFGLILSLAAATWALLRPKHPDQGRRRLIGYALFAAAFCVYVLVRLATNGR